jgi:toxin ParE1/3/4
VAEVKFTDEADRNVTEIFGYHSERDPAMALRIVQGIYEKAQLLRDLPMIGQRLMEIPDREVRALISGRYRILYTIRSSERIDIIGVYHERMDIIRRLGEES